MRTRTKVILAVGVLALGATSVVGASLAGGRGGHGWHGHGHDGGWSYARGERLFEQFDANGDGTLTQVEIDEVRSSQLTEFDANDDGSLTLDEYQVLWLDAMRERMVDQFQAHDDDGDGLVTGEEFGERYSSLARRLDRDDDGQVTEDDLRPWPRDRDRDDSDG
jgi:Ca2+-binding EF-hand superfamily protein